MIDSRMLRSKMLLKDVTQEKLAEVLGYNRTNINKKINNKMAVSLRDVELIQKLLDLTNDEVCDIFLSAK